MFKIRFLHNVSFLTLCIVLIVGFCRMTKISQLMGDDHCCFGKCCQKNRHVARTDASRLRRMWFLQLSRRSCTIIVPLYMQASRVLRELYSACYVQFTLVIVKRTGGASSRFCLKCVQHSWQWKQLQSRLLSVSSGSFEWHTKIEVHLQAQ